MMYQLTEPRKRHPASHICSQQTNFECMYVSTHLNHAPCRPLEMALERRTSEREAAVAELEASVVINAARQVQVSRHRPN